MKRVALFCLCLGVLSALHAEPANAQKIELFTDATMSSCELIDQSQALVTIHVFFTGSQKATLVRFKAPKPACWMGATWAYDWPNYTLSGTSQSDATVAFGWCLTPPVHVMRIYYFATGAALPCCEVTAMEPVSAQFLYTDCNFAEIPVTAGQKVVINPTAACRCQNPLAVQATTWGRVKSLYR